MLDMLCYANKINDWLEGIIWNWIESDSKKQEEQYKIQSNFPIEAEKELKDIFIFCLTIGLGAYIYSSCPFYFSHLSYSLFYFISFAFVVCRLSLVVLKFRIRISIKNTIFITCHDYWFDFGCYIQAAVYFLYSWYI